MKKFFLVAGEASGDVHGANLITALKEIHPEAVFKGIGGERMEQAGMQLVAHFKDVAYMGFVEVLIHLRKIFNHLQLAARSIKDFQADVLILIDYPGFNLRLMKKVRAFSPKIVYYISPQIWAWKAKRALLIKEYVDEMITILPFEQAFYKQYAIDVHYVGHPLLDELARLNIESMTEVQKTKHIALLPGSRVQEIKKMLPVYVRFAAMLPDYNFTIAGVNNIDSLIYENIVGKKKNIKIEISKTREILLKSEFALVTSGTATLETALLNIPQIVCYKSKLLSYWIAKQLIKVKYISLVNLIMGEPVLKELIQHACTANAILREFKALGEPDNKEKLMRAYRKLHRDLGGPGASKKAAEIILS